MSTNSPPNNSATSETSPVVGATGSAPTIPAAVTLTGISRLLGSQEPGKPGDTLARAVLIAVADEASAIATGRGAAADELPPETSFDRGARAALLLFAASLRRTAGWTGEVSRG